MHNTNVKNTEKKLSVTSKHPSILKFDNFCSYTTEDGKRLKILDFKSRGIVRGENIGSDQVCS